MSGIDAGVISTRLAVMADLVGYLSSLGAVTGAQLRDDLERRLAVERALCGLVDQAVDINAHVVTRLLGRPPQTQRESFELARRAGFLTEDLVARLAPSTGLRNLLVHDYVEVDLDRVAAVIPLAVEGYRDYVREVGAAALRAT